MSRDSTEGADLAAWFELAEEVARRHRQGHVLAVDPASVLRGAPTSWRPAAAGGIPADDVVALAGAALAALPLDDPARPALLEAAAGCLGSDLPALLRSVRPLIDEHLRPAGGGTPGTAPAEGEVGGVDDDDPDAGAAGPSPAVPPGGRAGRLRVAAGLGALVVVLVGAVAAVGSGDDAPREIRLADEPVTVEGPRPAVLRWDPPRLVVDVSGVRYRYRLDGVEEVAWRDDPRRPTLVVVAGDRRWSVPVPALEGLSGTAAPR